MIATFVELGRRLRAVEPGDGIVAEACRENPWFTPAEVCRALRTLADDMLEARKLELWLSRYPQLPVAEPCDVAVVMAGNIPAVGFFDLLCVLASGHRALVKPSSKDSVTMRFIVRTLLDIDPGTRVAFYDGGRVDAAIATGSDNANRYFRSQFGDIPSLLRGNRHSAAVLAGDESDEELQGLSDDIFAYSGLGCRNVSLIFLPRGSQLRLPRPADLNPKYLNNYRQTRALAAMCGREATDTGFAVLCRERDFPRELSCINYDFYDSTDEVRDFLSARDNELQCVVTRAIEHPRRAGFGRAQHPSLADMPDDRDVPAFLGGIKPAHSNTDRHHSL